MLISRENKSKKLKRKRQRGERGALAKSRFQGIACGDITEHDRLHDRLVEERLPEAGFHDIPSESLGRRLEIIADMPDGRRVSESQFRRSA